MGYLIENNYLIKTVVTIKEGDFRIMDATNPYLLIPNDRTFFIIPVAVYIKVDSSQTIAYGGLWNDLHLTNTGNYGSTDLCGTYKQSSSSSSELNSDSIYSFLINIQQTARFGGVSDPIDLETFFNTAPTSGNGDVTYTIFWIKQPI
jgi:hypothetical protein